MNKFKSINNTYLREEKFDLISAAYSIYYAKKPLNLIKDLIAKLKKNGKFFIFVPIKPNKIAEIAERFHKLPKKVNESLLIYEDIERFYKKNKYSYKKKFFRSKMKIDNLDDVVRFYKSTTFYKKNYETAVSEYLKTKFINKVFVFRKDSCLITLTK